MVIDGTVAVGARRGTSLGASRDLWPEPSLDREPAGDLPPTGRWAAGAVLAGVCGAFALVVLAYAAARQRIPGAEAMFWIGQLGVYGTALAGLLTRRRTAGERLAVVCLVGAGQALVTYAYSPRVRAFPDETQHWRTLGDLLRTGSLFTDNPTLPVSPRFPGMELTTAFLTRAVHLSPLWSATVVTVACHLLLATVAYGLYLELTGHSRVAGVAAVFATTSPDGFTFNSYYAYGTFALPFFVLALRAVTSGSDRRLSWPAVALTAAALAVCVVSHPLTALVAICLVALLAVLVRLVGGRRELSLRCALAAGAGAVVATTWVGLCARSAVGYLASPVRDVFAGFLGGGQAASGGGSASGGVQRGLGEQALILAGMSLTMVLLLVGVVALFRWRPRSAAMALGCGGLTWLVVVAVRFLTARGAELSTRGLSYVMVLAALPMAVAVVRLAGAGRGRFLAWGASLLVVLGSLCVGWPPPWERLPGTFRIDGFDAGVDANGVALARWVNGTLGPDDRVACDASTCSLVGAFARSVPVADAGELFYAPAFGPVADRAVREHDVQYVVVNVELGRTAPVAGFYFGNDPRGSWPDASGPIAARALTKFDDDPRVDRVYDDGEYRVYDVRGVHGAW